MLYAVVDIETTGGHASANGITEVAINIHDGNEIVESYTTLINPKQPIPVYITALTGIDDNMLSDAPTFDDVALQIYQLLNDKIFVAHNVNFDYSFLKHHLAAAGYDLQCKKLCTVRLSRKLIPGKSSYSLGKLCTALQIPIQNRHRAAGDADATSILFNLLLEYDQEGIIAEMLKKTSKEQVLPPHLDKASILRLPHQPGVYYFKDSKGKIIYVGKAKDLKKRVTSHFTGNTPNRQRQDFLRTIHDVDHVICGTELMALILEANEIKRLWPENNRAMKRYEHKYDLYIFEDQNGYLRLAIDKHKKNNNSFQSFNSLLEGYNFLNQLVDKYQLCAKLCYLQKTATKCYAHENGQCFGACSGIETVSVYNKKLNTALADIQKQQPSFALVDEGRKDNEFSCLVVENGKFYGMGYFTDKNYLTDGLAPIKNDLSIYQSNSYILNLILNYAEQHPQKLYKL
ncbi:MULTISPECIES: exonuclease domain-containing protein [unclassified Pedobacter]|uniref:exonuclease domain-containing protein n=1 Tax=unclassified Pedobacter TaxID=2628915 RepID=UPI001D8363B3|nr:MULTISPECIES: exonuclease domain-containing protein [unclassified Pedobacter]CAH0132193.1 putative ATP-dependent helicase DinG homolog [Pedobacter sp. Bi36]CAH0187709.1 putative ATP-dependent helicase DinG homolog [Pedobacter sp. Bi126]